jgi:hypothetical protein
MKTMSHDAVTRFLNREHFTPKDLFEENRAQIILKGATLSVDDCILDKPYADPTCNDLVTWLYSGLHHGVVKGICLVTLFYNDADGKRFPINFRVYKPAKDTEKQATKNDLFQEMVDEVIGWGMQPSFVTADAWYGSLGNMKFLRDHQIDWLFGMKENRIVSETAHDSHPVSEVLSVAGSKQLHLQGYGQVRVFRRDDQHGVPRFYVTSKIDLTLEEFEIQHDRHWTIETYHRAIKQLCSAEGCSARSAQSQENHLFCVLRAFSILERKVQLGSLKNWYELKRTLHQDAVRKFIQTTCLEFVSA